MHSYSYVLARVKFLFVKDTRQLLLLPLESMSSKEMYFLKAMHSYSIELLAGHLSIHILYSHWKQYVLLGSPLLNPRDVNKSKRWGGIQLSLPSEKRFSECGPQSSSSSPISPSPNKIRNRAGGAQQPVLTSPSGDPMRDEVLITTKVVTADELLPGKLLFYERVFRYVLWVPSEVLPSESAPSPGTAGCMQPRWTAGMQEGCSGPMDMPVWKA